MASLTINPELKTKYQELHSNYWRVVRSIETILPAVATCLVSRKDLNLLGQLRNDLIDRSERLKFAMEGMNDIRREIDFPLINIDETLEKVWNHINKFLPHDKMVNAKVNPEDYL